MESKNEGHWICLADSKAVVHYRYKRALWFFCCPGMWEAAENLGCAPHITVSPKNRAHRLGETVVGRAWSQL